MTVKWKFTSIEQVAEFFAKQGADIRGRIRTDTTAGSKRTMQAEAHAYEQAAMIVRNAVIAPIAALPSLAGEEA